MIKKKGRRKIISRKWRKGRKKNEEN